MGKSLEDIRNDIAQRDTKAQHIIDLLKAGYAKTSGQVVNEVEERWKIQQADIRRRIDAGERVSATELLMDGYFKVDEAGKAKESRGE
ncbi:hypothetical protein [Paenibacillus flagellatus]|uniref:Uncharacterized protein n=1 Tax=Paenibacillus flagellatus TaxID=2211139 RepID=A0A2V5JTW9_9BACL|nr:hypothetical protein [Paenibacillus flagellatus]PYI49949.1 hypothetical protein DLM86_31495 [Paenibacillus flagellatus]